MLPQELIIVVDENDHPQGTAEKLEAHRKGLCHRAFSIFILRKNQEWELLLQQRAASKYHSPNLWTNSCCSHPRPGETMLAAGKRRLKEELGLSIPLRAIGRFHYIAHFENGLTENEVDHVLIGPYQDETIDPDPKEVQAYRWASFSALGKELIETPHLFTPWLKTAWEMVVGFVE